MNGVPQGDDVAASVTVGHRSWRFGTFLSVAAARIDYMAPVRGQGVLGDWLRVITYDSAGRIMGGGSV